MRILKVVMAVLCVAGMAACTPKERCVENPYFEHTSTTSMDIRKVEMNDSATVVSVDVYQRPKFWISFTSKMHLLAEGKKYAIKKVEGAEIDQYFWMPESGEASFKVIFEPMPLSVKVFDFIEGDKPADWNVYGVDVTGKKQFEANQAVPAEVIEATKRIPETIPAPEFTIGETKLNIHLLNNRKGKKPLITMYLNNSWGSQEEISVKNFLNENEAEVTFWQFGPAQVLLGVDDMFMGDVFLKAGEKVDVYLDMNKAVYDVLKQREARKGVKCPMEMAMLYANGVYAWMNGWERMEMREYALQMHSRDFLGENGYKLTADAYVDKLIEKYNELANRIGKSDYSSKEKELLMIYLKQEVVVATASADGLRYNNAYYAFKGKRPDITIDRLTEKQYARVAALFDVTDPTLIWGPNFMEYMVSFTKSRGHETYWPESAGTEKTVLGVMGKYYDYVSSVVNGVDLTDQEWKEIKAIDNVFVRELLVKKHELNLAALKAVEGKAVIEKTPKVAAEKLLKAIIAPYKGKVVLVDFWNTWCGPCRAALRGVEPLKEKELKHKDLVWLYIANETSPLMTYQTMIAEIEGKHYRLTNEQWRVICDELKIKGIPSYVLVDRDGKYALRNDLRDHGKLKATLQKMLEE